MEVDIYRIILLVLIYKLMQGQVMNKQGMEKQLTQQEKIKKAIADMDKLQHLFHLVQFKSVKQSRINKIQKHPCDFLQQNYQLMVHMFYLTYFAYKYQVNVYVYEQLCINKWGILFRYYSFYDKYASFMKKIDYQNKFKENLFTCVCQTHGITKTYNQLSPSPIKTKRQQLQYSKFNSLDAQFLILSEGPMDFKLQPKVILKQLEQIEFIRQKLYILKVLSSILLPTVKNNTSQKFIQNYIENVKEEEVAIKRIFQNKQTNQAMAAQFRSRMLRFLMHLNKSGLNSSTQAQKTNSQKSKQNKVLVAQLVLELKRSSKSPQQQLKMEESTNQNKSNKGSQSEFEKASPNRVKLFIYMKVNPNLQSVFLQVTLQFVAKKICELHYLQIQAAWQRICEKWKVLIDKHVQFSQFNPAFIQMSFKPEGITITDRIKDHPPAHLITYLIAYIDRLIMVYLLLEDIVQFYHLRQNSLQFYQNQNRRLFLNDGKIQIIAKSGFTAQRYYEHYLKNTIMQTKQHMAKQSKN